MMNKNKCLRKKLNELEEKCQLLDEYNDQCLLEIARLNKELEKEKAFRLLLSRVIEMPNDFLIIENNNPLPF